MNAGKYSHYAVKAGRVKGVYTSWKDCAEQVLGYSGAQFKGFKNLEDALAYMNKGSDGNGKGKGKTVSPLLTAGEKLQPQMAKLDVGSCRSLATQPGSSTRHGSVQMCSSQEWEFVPETQGRGFLIAEEMEFYLL
ncbi:hypothetical protein PIB30_023187 [Stylosanthes scabra]|uniref:Ribonuclease H1 N-terminal domain-containing protein n=1 Tax=Stylosanthes scabra TaxID=79078 RepID=A0ABU6U8B0_9FABA|nr:hypothetical protein [Stylosanthes scabra]